MWRQGARALPVLRAGGILMGNSNHKANDIGRFTIADIMQGIPGGFFIYRADSGEELIYANDAMLRLFRCDTIEEFQEHTGNSFRGIVHPEDLERVEAYIAHQVADDLQAMDYVEYRIIRRDGEVCWVEDFGHLVHDEREGDIFYVFISDITERIKRQRRERVIHQEMIDAASSREKQYMEMIQALSTDYTNVYRVNLTKDSVWAFRMSNAIVQNFGKRFQEGSYKDLIRYYVESSVYEPDREMFMAYADPGHLMKVLEQEDTCAINYRVMRNGEIEYYRMKVSRIKSAREDVEIAIGFSNVDADIRQEMEQRKLVEYALAQAQHANSAKTAFLSNMSHDMRTPMNAIIGFSAIAASHINNPGRVKDCLEKIMSSSNHLLSLINDILDMSRIESGKVQIQEKECNLSELLHTLINIIQPQAKGKQLDFLVDTFDVTDEDIFADPLKLNQIFINILGNAVKFTPVGGTISLRIRQKPCSVTGYGTYEFTIKDTGIGMSREFLEHIFEPFEREHSALKLGIEGTGLGMAITKNLVDIMGGTIAVSSVQGKGTEFVISLDLKLQENSSVSRNIVELEGLRALVVDDDFDTCDSVTSMLGQIGMRSEWTTSAREAVLRARKAYDDQDPFHTYILDLNMPEYSGLEVARKIRKMVGEDVPIIILTAYDWTDVEDEAREAGITAFCTKPLFMSDLKAALLKANHLAEEIVLEESYTDEDFSGKRVLVVDDNELNREIAMEILQEAGFTVEVAVDGAEAVQMVEQSEEYHYDVILTDIQMPVMDGYEEVLAIRGMKRRDVASMPIIAMTANAFKEDKALALKCGMNGHIAKPLDIRAVFQILHEHLK